MVHYRQPTVAAEKGQNIYTVLEVQLSGRHLHSIHIRHLGFDLPSTTKIKKDLHKQIKQTIIKNEETKKFH